MHKAGFQQRLRLRCKRQSPLHLGDIQRLDTERIAREGDAVLMPFMDRNGVHATQVPRIIRPVAQPVIRRLAIAVGGIVDRWHRLAQFAVIVDFTIRYQRGRSGEERLIAGHQVDDRQPVLHQGDAADDCMTGAVGASVLQELLIGRGKSRLDRAVAHR